MHTFCSFPEIPSCSGSFLVFISLNYVNFIFVLFCITFLLYKKKTFLRSYSSPTGTSTSSVEFVAGSCVSGFVSVVSSGVSTAGVEVSLLTFFVTLNIILVIGVYVSTERTSLETTFPFKNLVIVVWTFLPTAPFCLTFSVPSGKVLSSIYCVWYGVVANKTDSLESSSLAAVLPTSKGSKATLVLDISSINRAAYIAVYTQKNAGANVDNVIYNIWLQK